MEHFPGQENLDDIKNEIIELLKKESIDEVKEKYLYWLKLKEADIESKTNPVKYRLKQIELNIERGDIYNQAGMPDEAYKNYCDACLQLDNELNIPENDPLKINNRIINSLIVKVKQKIASL